MHHFFADKENITGTSVMITGRDYNHAVNVLRLRNGEKVMVSDGEGRDLYCRVGDVADGVLILDIDFAAEENHELASRVILYQSLPKSDRMELIIQKAAELGATDIVPVISRNCVMKLDEKKIPARTARWQAIAEAAAKQCKRSVIPKVHLPAPFAEAVKRAEEEGGVSVIPYEEERGMTGMCEALLSFLPGTPVSVFTGPEGGYDRLEIKHALSHGIKPVSLGKRILRSETAAIAMLSLIMIRLEIAKEMEMNFAGGRS